jgi:hypothetical protein
MGTGSGVVSVAVGEVGTAFGEVAGRGAGRGGGGGWARALAAVSIPDIPRRIPTAPVFDHAPAKPATCRPAEKIRIRVHIVISILSRVPRGARPEKPHAV